MPGDSHEFHGKLKHAPPSRQSHPAVSSPSHRSGLTGLFAFSLQYSEDGADILGIDHIERPSRN
jgi:hypothetical protein